MSQRDKDIPSIQSALDAGDLAGAVALWRQGKARDAGAWKSLLALSQACEGARQFDLAREIENKVREALGVPLLPPVQAAAGGE